MNLSREKQAKTIMFKREFQKKTKLYAFLFETLANLGRVELAI